MDTNRKSALLTASATVLSALFLLAALRVTHPANSGPQSASKHRTGLAEQQMQGGYWRADHTFQPVLILTNILETTALTVTPVLYAADGTEYDLPPVTLQPAGVASIDIRQSLSAAPDEIRDHFSDHGSTGVKYFWQWAGAVGAMVQNRDAKRSLNFNFDLRAQMVMHPAASTAVVREGLWWKADEGVTAFLSLLNVSGHAVQAEVQVISKDGRVEDERTVNLQVRETHVLDLLQDSLGNSGGLRVTYAGAERDIVLAGGLENAQEGYHAQIPFNTIQDAQSPSTIAVSSVGLTSGTPDPSLNFPPGTKFGGYFALRNTSGRPILVSSTLYYMEGTEVRTRSLKGLGVAANEARYFDTEDVSKFLGLSAFSGPFNLVFSYEGNPSDVIIASGSIAQTKKYDSQANMRAVGNSQAIGLKDWDLSNGNETMISLLNLGDKDQGLAVTFFFDGGRYRLPVDLKSGGSTVLRVSEIIRMQQADPDGQKIPPGTLQGSAVLSGASGYPEWINVGVSVAVINVSTATCGNKCPTCYGYSDFQVQGVSSTAPVGGTATFKALALGQNGVWTDVTRGDPANGVNVVWSSDNSNVATSQGAGAFTGVSAGGFNAIANATLLDENPDCPEGSNQPCPSSPYFGSAGGTITPRIDSISPSKGPQSLTTSVTISGAGLTGATVAAGTGITVTVRSTTSTTITADFAAAGNATPGNHSVTATVGGQTSSAVNFFIQVPTSLSIVSGDSTTPEAQCTVTSGGTQYTGCGVTRAFTYQVKDQAGNMIQAGGLPVWDSFGTVSPNPLNIGGFGTTCTPANTGPCGLTTDPNGQFDERALSVCSVVCRSNGVCTTGGPSVVGQTWHVGTGAVTQNISYYCQKVLVNGQ